MVLQNAKPKTNIDKSFSKSLLLILGVGAASIAAGTLLYKFSQGTDRKLNSSIRLLSNDVPRDQDASPMQSAPIQNAQDVPILLKDAPSVPIQSIPKDAPPVARMILRKNTNLLWGLCAILIMNATRSDLPNVDLFEVYYHSQNRDIRNNIITDSIVDTVDLNKISNIEDINSIDNSILNMTETVDLSKISNIEDINSIDNSMLDMAETANMRQISNTNLEDLQDNLEKNFSDTSFFNFGDLNFIFHIPILIGSLLLPYLIKIRWTYSSEKDGIRQILKMRQELKPELNASEHRLLKLEEFKKENLNRIEKKMEEIRSQGQQMYDVHKVDNEAFKTFRKNYDRIDTEFDNLYQKLRTTSRLIKKELKKVKFLNNDTRNYAIYQLYIKKPSSLYKLYCLFFKPSYPQFNYPESNLICKKQQNLICKKQQEKLNLLNLHHIQQEDLCYF